MKALIVREPWISLILSGSKPWEMRGRGIAHRGPFALVRAGGGLVVGTARLDDVGAPLSWAEFDAAEARHGIPAAGRRAAFDRGWNVPWILSAAVPLARPVPYRHPKGAVTWVVLSDAEAAAVRAAA